MEGPANNGGAGQRGGAGLSQLLYIESIIYDKPKVLIDINELYLINIYLINDAETLFQKKIIEESMIIKYIR